MADQSPMEPLKKLAEAAVAKLREAGFETVNIAFAPNLDGGPDFVQIVAQVADDAATNAVAKSEVDEEEAKMFAELERSIRKDKEAEQEAVAAEGLERLARELAEGKGILGDDDAT